MSSFREIWKNIDFRTSHYFFLIFGLFLKNVFIFFLFFKNGFFSYLKRKVKTRKTIEKFSRFLQKTPIFLFFFEKNVRNFLSGKFFDLTNFNFFKRCLKNSSKGNKSIWKKYWVVCEKTAKTIDFVGFEMPTRPSIQAGSRLGPRRAGVTVQLGDAFPTFSFFLLLFCVFLFSFFFFFSFSYSKLK